MLPRNDGDNALGRPATEAVAPAPGDRDVRRQVGITFLLLIPLLPRAVRMLFREWASPVLAGVEVEGVGILPGIGVLPPQEAHLEGAGGAGTAQQQLGEAALR